MAFVAIGYDHAISNIFLLSLGMNLDMTSISLGQVFMNIIPALLGNMFGGVVLVAVI